MYFNLKSVILKYCSTKDHKHWFALTHSDKVTYIASLHTMTNGPLLLD